VTFEVRVATVALAAFAAASLLAGALIPVLRARLGGTTAASRARRLARLRLLPGMAALGAGALALAAFLAFEPRRPYEAIGSTVPAMAVLGAALIAASLWRGVTMFIATRRLSREWLNRATPQSLPGVDVPVLAVASDFPVVAVIGVRRPRLVIAESVLRECSPAELQAILAHEVGHIRRGDNLQRVLLGLVPDVLSWTPIARRLFDEWRSAAEQAADDDAAGQDMDVRLHLASALVKVARLAVGAPPRVPLPVSALHNGDDLDRRVRRLLDAGAPGTPPRPRSGLVRAALGAAIAAAFTVLEPLHAWLETAIHALP
jgi:Zn-dependent protease with chaperone function